MSNVYASEPATSGRVIFETTRGPIEVQLWCRECPQTTRLFLQLCLDGFYDNMLFHRIIPKTLIQTGALRHPQTPDITPEMDKYRSLIRADYALERRKYELHSRLRFSHRGLVAMALSAQETDEDDVELQPQFFVTLEEAPYLDGKHVIFGKVDAPTIFNAIKIGDTDVDESTHQPTGELAHAPRVKSVKIVDNPLHGDTISQHDKIPWRVEKKKASRKKKRKGKRDVNVLSFGDDIEEESNGFVSSKIMSSHDLLQSKSFSKTVDKEVKESIEKKEEAVLEPRGEIKTVQSQPPPVESKSVDRESPTLNNSSSIHDIVEPVTEDSKPGAVPDPPKRAEEDSEYSSSAHPAEKAAKPEKQSAKKVKRSIVEDRRSKYIKRKKGKRDREDETMDRLFAFKSKVREGVASRNVAIAKKDNKENSLASRMARRIERSANDSAQDEADQGYHGQVLESDGEEDRSRNWLQTKFKCRRHMDHHAKDIRQGMGSDGRSADDYKIVDDRKRERDDSPPRHHKTHHKHSKRRHHRERAQDRM